MIFHVFICILHHVRVYYEHATWPAPSWLDSSAQLVEHYTAIAQVMGSNPVQESTSFSDWLSCTYNCDAH